MIYICIPAHNEDRTIGVLLWKVRQVLANFPRDYQILVADDASTDATAEVLGPYERVMPLVVFRNTERKGYASSLEMLLREAVRRSEYPKRDIVVTLQADFTEDPESIVAMLKRIEAGADVVTGESPLPDDSFPRSYRWARRAARYLTSRRGPEGVSDTLTGLRVYRVLVLKKAFDARQGKRLLTWDGWAANTELLLEVQPHSRRTEAMPVAFRPERLQRPRRFDFWATLKQAWGVSRGRSGPLEHVAPLQPGTRERAAGNAPGRSRHGTPGGEAVSNGGAARGDNGQRGRRNGRDSQEQRGREAREGRSRRGREDQEQRPTASRRRGQPDQETRQKREPQAQENRRTQGPKPKEVRAGQESLEQEARPRRERQQRTRRDSSERRERRPQQSEPAPQEIVLQDALQAEPTDLQKVATADQVAPAPDTIAGEMASQPRKRRRRRRGSGTSKNVPSADTQAEMFDPAPGVLDDGESDEAAAANAESGDEGGADGEPVKKRRRSRGRRGGRGRSRRSSALESIGEEGGEEGGEAPQGAVPADVPVAVAAERPAEPKSQQVPSAAEAPPRAPQMNEG